MCRKATRHVVDTWLVCHSATPQGCCAPDTHCPASRASSGATTPVRKISAHEFERGGLLKPIVNNIDGTPTFLSCADSPAQRPQRRSRHDLRLLDEKELIFELVCIIMNPIRFNSLAKIQQRIIILKVITMPVLRIKFSCVKTVNLLFKCC